MLKLFAGPIVVAAGYAAGSYYGADAEQVVHKDPSATYAAVDLAIENLRPRGTTFFEGGTPTPYEIRVDRRPGERLQIMLFFAGKEGAAADLRFLGENGDHDTLMKMKIHADRAVLVTVLAGTDKARLAYAPDWMLNLSVRPLLNQIAGQIEAGQTAHLDAASDGQTEAQWESNLSDQERDQLAQWRQYEATRPLVDPDAAARNSMDRKSD